jgi:hypothetical protein
MLSYLPLVVPTLVEKFFQFANRVTSEDVGNLYLAVIAKIYELNKMQR